MNTTAQRVQSFQPSRVVGTGQRRSDQCNQRNNLESVEEGNSRSTDHITQTKRREGGLGEVTKRENALKKWRQRLQKQQKKWILARIERVFQSMSVSKAKVDVHHDSNSVLVKLLQDANERENTLKLDVERWHWLT